MIVTTISSQRIRTISLPQKIKGRYWLYEATEGRDLPLLTVEGVNDAWQIKSGKDIQILAAENFKETVKNATLTPGGVLYLKKNTEEEFLVVFSEADTEDRKTYTKLLASPEKEIRIGTADQCEIVFNHSVVSKFHASIMFHNGKWFLRDGDGYRASTNGVYVNGERFTEGKLNFGDCIFIMGLKIIVGDGFFAMNNPDGKVSLSHDIKPFIISNQVEEGETEEETELEEVSYFCRIPRFKRDIDTITFNIDPPPNSPITEELPLVLVLGSSLAMGIMSAVTLVTAILNSNVTSMVMGGSMLIGTVMLPIITRLYEKKRKQKKEGVRQQRYKEYLDSVAQKIKEECALQEEILNENGITVRDCEKRIMEEKNNLWERGPGQNDFLHIRVGQGTCSLDAKIAYAERHFSIEDDNLKDELYSLCEEPKILHNIPITYSLFDNYISGVIGNNREQIISFAKDMIVQIAALYSYDEVKMIFLYDESEEKWFNFAKWLPHAWNNDKSFRFVATNQQEAKEITAYLEKELARRKEIPENEKEKIEPYYVVFSMSPKLAGRAEFVNDILSHKENLYFSVVSFYNTLNELPKECSLIVELDKEGIGRLYNREDITGKDTKFSIDPHIIYHPRDLSVKLANIPLDTKDSQSGMPNMITFLQMFGVGKVEHLNPLGRWKENDPTKSLEAIVGVDAYGELFKLDLHEKHHGPHGLVAGMTGSGKSEFIITYILSLAVNYHPNEVCFVLIDYKGGGMAKSFENLPHTAGVITNLDGSSIKRSLISIESELKRRQAIFAETSKKINVSNIDIYKYQKLYRDGTVKEPLQHMFIISDEFAELKAQQPDFMAQLVSAARIGRSLGVHLILATQKPSGVVDDQIWSNSRFRVCLKVQERADSMDMLKRPEAAELVQTGRFYLQVGYNELFEIGQSAWSGAPYYPSEHVIKEKDDSIVVVDRNGHPIKTVKPDKRPKQFKNAKKQLDAITDYLCEIAREENIKIRPLWLDPIPPMILLNDIKKKYSVESKPYILDPVIGEYDDPAHQKQDVFRLPISKEGNAIIYGTAGSGKTTFLNAMIYSLIQEHTPDEVNLYILDFASETLRAFSKAPHVGDVILSYETEKIYNLLKLLHNEMLKRKKCFSDYGGDYSSYIQESGKTEPAIVVVINNYASFAEQYEDAEEAMMLLSREGAKYGIFFVLTATGVSAVRLRIQQNFGQLVAMQMNDESDYSTIVGKTEGLYPAKYTGRGLVKIDDSLYEFQAADVAVGKAPYKFIQETCSQTAKSWHGRRAPAVPILPDIVDAAFLKNYQDPANLLSIPIGVAKNSLNVYSYPFDASYITMVLSEEEEYVDFIGALASYMGKELQLKGIVLDAEQMIEQPTGTMKLINNSKECVLAVVQLFEMVRERNNSYKDAMELGTDTPVFEHETVIINSYSALCDVLDSKGKEMLQLILEKGQVAYNLTVILAERARDASSVQYEKWYKSQMSSSDGIWVGSGITDQFLLKTTKITSEMREECTPEFGFVIQKGKSLKLKFLSSNSEAYDE